MSHVPPDPSGMRRRSAVPWYRRVLIWLGFRSAPLPEGDRPAGLGDAPPIPSLVERPEISETREFRCESPARGGGFDFNVLVHCTWDAKVLDGTVPQFQMPQLQREVVRDQLTQREKEVAGSLEASVREITRRHGPMDCAAVERDINALSYRWVDGGLEITCQLRAVVEPDVAIRDHLRRTSLRDIEIQDEETATRQRVELWRAQVAEWRKLLEEWPGDRTTSDAVVLTLRPEDIESVASRPQDGVNAERERLIAEVNGWVERIQELGHEEGLFQVDSAIVRLMEYLGVLPPRRDGGHQGGDGDDGLVGPALPA